MRVHLVNPSNLSFGTSVITPRWLYVLAAATPAWCGDPTVTDETIDPFDLDTVDEGDVVGIGIHTGNVLKGYEVGRAARARGATVVYGGIHSTLYPDETRERGGAHARAVHRAGRAAPGAGRGVPRTAKAAHSERVHLPQ